MVCIAHDALKADALEQRLLGTELLQSLGEGQLGLSTLWHILEGPFNPFDHCHAILFHRIAETAYLGLVLEDEHLFHHALFADRRLDGRIDGEVGLFGLHIDGHAEGLEVGGDGVILADVHTFLFQVTGHFGRDLFFTYI